MYWSQTEREELTCHSFSCLNIRKNKTEKFTKFLFSLSMEFMQFYNNLIDLLYVTASKILTVKFEYSSACQKQISHSQHISSSNTCCIIYLTESIHYPLSKFADLTFLSIKMLLLWIKIHFVTISKFWHKRFKCYKERLQDRKHIWNAITLEMSRLLAQVWN